MTQILASLFGFGALYFVLTLLRDAGVFQSVRSINLMGAPYVLSGEKYLGVEDIAVSPEGHAFFSQQLYGHHSQPGTLMSWDLGAAQLGNEPSVLQTGYQGPFHPHGLALTPKGTRLLVVNHRSDDEDTVEIFSRDGLKLTHEGSIPCAANANDLVAVDEERFYLTIDHGSTSAIGKSLEDYSRIAKGRIDFFDGKSFVPVAHGVAYANGLVVSRDGKMLLVAAMLERRVRRFARDPATSALSEIAPIELDFAPDNVAWAESGSLFAAGHPKLLKLSGMRKRLENRSPSRICEILNPISDQPIQKTIYEDDGSAFAATSVLVEWNHIRIAGSVFDHRILVFGAPKGA